MPKSRFKFCPVPDPHDVFPDYKVYLRAAAIYGEGYCKAFKTKDLYLGLVRQTQLCGWVWVNGLYRSPCHYRTRQLTAEALEARVKGQA